jgi:hypothetical protein
MRNKLYRILFKDTMGESCKSKKDRQYNGQEKDRQYNGQEKGKTMLNNNDHTTYK